MTDFSGFVYWAFDERRQLVKIGASKNPAARIGGMRKEVILIAQWATDMLYDDEAAVHRLFADHRKSGTEWFYLQDDERVKVDEFFASPREYKVFEPPTKFLLSVQHCFRCGYQWEPRKAVSKSCPNCHSYKWRIAREVNHKDGDHLNNNIDNLEIQERVIVPIDET